MPKIVCVCGVCGTLFERWPADVGAFCSYSCRSKAVSYRRWGNPIIRFWSKVEYGGTGCWPWRGYVDPATGYGQTTFDGQRVSTHRLAYLLAYGQIPPTLYVLHRCDWSVCVRPSHLYAGTQSQNMLDRWERRIW